MAGRAGWCSTPWPPSYTKTVTASSYQPTGTNGPQLPAYAVDVQQAVGVVMACADIDAATALHRLRAYARHSTRPMRDVVAEVRTLRLPFDPATPA